jgi:hypothetical protein
VSEKQSSGFPVAFLVGLAVMAAIAGGAYLLVNKFQSPIPAEQHLALSEADKADAAKIRFSDFQLSRATNMLGHELTYVVGTVSNESGRTVNDLEVTVEFRDLLNQVVLRESRLLFGKNPAPLPAGQKREFQLTFEHVPNDWNRHPPDFRVTGARFE